MFQDVRFPKGRVVKKIKGGPDSLKKVVVLLRQRGFTGYLKVWAKGDPNVGYVVMSEGGRALAIFSGPKGFLLGRDALPRFRKLAGNEDFTIEVHTDVDVKSILSNLPRKEKGGSKKDLNTTKKSARKRRGQERVLEALGQGLAKVIEAFAEKGKGERRAEDLAHELDNDAPRKTKPSLKMPKKGQTAARGKKGEKPDTAKGMARKKPTKGKRRVVEEPSREPVDRQTGLADEFTFENYLVSKSNEFAHAACYALAQGSPESYSPLLLVGEPGLGKTHLLNAVGNLVVKSRPELKLRYLTASQFRLELEEAEKSDRVSQFRSSFRDLDILIFDDLQDMEGRSRAQEEILQLFEDFQSKGKPLLLAADRRPSEMGQLDSRLVSRFQSGLVAGLMPPDLETRLRFLKRRMEARKDPCPEEVLHYLAESIPLDLRELDGALNSVLAYASTLGRKIDVALAKEALKGPASGRLGETTPVVSLDLRPAHSYMVKEERPRLAYRIFAGKAKGVKGMLITRTNPSKLRESYGLDGVDILWLTDRTESAENTVEPVLERLAHTVESFLYAGGPGIIMLDGLEYLRSNNGFEPVLKFIRHVVDDISESDFTFVLPINPATLEGRELSVLEREMEVFQS